MIWAAAGGTVVLIVIVLALAFNRTRLAKQVGEMGSEIDQLKEKIDAWRDAIESRVAADPSLADLAGMFDDDEPDPSP